MAVAARRLVALPAARSVTSLAAVPNVRPTHGEQAKEWIRENMEEYFRKEPLRDYRSRGALSLRQMDDRFSFLRPGTVVLDLGSFPGGWSQVAVERTVAQTGEGRVIGVDKVAMDPLDNHTFVRLDVSSDDAVATVREALNGERADVVLSDLSDPAVGLHPEDHLASMQCALYAAQIMESTLRLGGWFIVKFLRGMEQANWKTYLDSRFHTVRSIRPAAARSTDREMFYCCRGFNGRGSTLAEEVSRRVNARHQGLDRWDANMRRS